MTQRFYIFRGLPCSGKTNFAKEMINLDPWIVRVNKNEIAQMLFQKTSNLDRLQEDNIKLIQKSSIETALRAGLTVIDDNYNLKADDVKSLYTLGNKNGVKADVISFETSVDSCVQRDSNRENSVGEFFIRDLAARFMKKGLLTKEPENVGLPTFAGKRHVPNPNLPKAIWLDADGTFFSMDPAVRSPFEFDKVHLDLVNHHIADLVKACVKDNYKVVVMTGRDEICREATWKAFVDAGVTPDDMFMRPNGSKEIPDNEIKYHMYWEHVAHKYDIRFALDDRQAVVDLTREVLGIPVLQVAPGDF